MTYPSFQPTPMPHFEGFDEDDDITGNIIFTLSCLFGAILFVGASVCCSYYCCSDEPAALGDQYQYMDE